MTRADKTEFNKMKVAVRKCLTVGWSSFQVSSFDNRPSGDGRDSEPQQKDMAMLPESPVPTRVHQNSTHLIC